MRALTGVAAGSSLMSLLRVYTGDYVPSDVSLKIGLKATMTLFSAQTIILFTCIPLAPCVLQAPDAIIS